MLLPFNRDRLKRRNALDIEQQASTAGDRTSTQSFAETLEVSEVVRELAFATGIDAATNDLETKAALYIRPLRAVMRS